MRNAWVLAALLLTVACDDTSEPNPALRLGDSATPPKASTAVATPPTPSAAPSVTEKRALTGVLSEDDFKKLHELRPDDAPAPRGSMLDLKSSRAYLSLPEKAEPPLPAVVVIHEWWGLNQHIKHWADRLAADGYAALAVDLYGGKVAETSDEAMKLMKAVDDESALATLREAYAWLGTDPRVNATRRASIGWCFGGKWSLELALAAPDMDAAVFYYGHVTTDAERLAELDAPLLAVFGNQDEGIPPKMVNRFEMGLEQAGGKTYEVLRLEGQHAFANPSSKRYEPKSAAEAWRKVRAFLSKNLRPDG